MPLNLCTVTGTIYLPSGAVAAYAEVRVVRCVKAGVVIALTPVKVTSDANGAVSFTVPRGCTAYIYSYAVGLSEKGQAGVALPIPDAATATLESLIAVASVPNTGLTVKQGGNPLANKIGTLNFTNATITETPAGEANVTVTAGAPAAYLHTQSSASATWTINHNLGYRPSVEIWDTGGREMDAEIVHTSLNQTVIYFSAAYAGSARLL